MWGTATYIAPEVILTKCYDKACDVFSIGVLFYLMLAKKFPFKEKTSNATLKSITNDPVPVHVLQSKCTDNNAIILTQGKL